MSRSLTREQVRRVDAIAIEELEIPSIVLMENAGRNAADRVAELVRQRISARVILFCGTGNNGGDGFVIARHLVNRGFSVLVNLVGEESRLSPDARTNYRILRNMGVEVASASTGQAVEAAVQRIRNDDVVVEALLGTGFQGDIREPLTGLIDGVNRAAKAVLVAIDVPTGLDCDTGRPANAAIRADCTVTFVASKVGFHEPGAAAYTGRVFVVDIGAPPALVERVLRDQSQAE